jgi:hypothetical protein
MNPIFLVSGFRRGMLQCKPFPIRRFDFLHCGIDHWETRLANLRSLLLLAPRFLAPLFPRSLVPWFKKMGGKFSLAAALSLGFLEVNQCCFTARV